MCVCVSVSVCMCECGAHSFAELVKVNESQFLVGLFSPHSKPRHKVCGTQKPPAHKHTNTHTRLVSSIQSFIDTSTIMYIHVWCLHYTLSWFPSPVESSPVPLHSRGEVRA